MSTVKQMVKWQKDLMVYQDINTTFIMEGNVHDRQPWVDPKTGACIMVSLSQYLHYYLSEVGYDPVIFYNRIDGFDNPFSEEMKKNFFREVSAKEDDPMPICEATKLIRLAMKNTDRPSAIIVNMANTIATSPDNLSDEETEYFTRFMLASKERSQAQSMKNKNMLTNLLFLIVDKVNDIPAWFYLHNPYVKTLTVSRPDNEVRAAVIDGRINRMKGADELAPEEKKKYRDEFIAMTDGMTLVELYGILNMCLKNEHPITRIRDAVKLFRFGETESHWDKLEPEKVRSVEKYLSERVKGQEAAVRMVSEVLTRACLGMSGIQGSSSSKPKGVLFFAGPTGTGKTELAKTIATFIFGDESFVTRFDMSEFQQPHSDQRLLGAPPGYIGYDEGGQLTNAVKAKPFCVLLFDEIEKAHPSILDKFLQILDDGRITDSSGETVFFSEALIIFTSNLGVVEEDPVTRRRRPTISPDDDYETNSKKLLSAIKDYFKFTIGRPELLNRIGENFVVFDFIRGKAVEEILDLKLRAVAANMKHDKELTLELMPPFRKRLLELANSDLSNGGRGIGNLVEARLLNPLASVIRDTKDLKAGDTIRILDFDPNGVQPFVYTVEKG